MVFKGFEDENGNIIPVQGAGTVYDEEKNSLALGKDTVAIGQGQLVFGRKNIADISKAEIVGGGGVYNLGDVVAEEFQDGDTLSRAIYLGNSINEVETAIKAMTLIGDTDDFVFNIGTEGELTPSELESYIKSINGYILCVYALYKTTKIEVSARIEAVVKEHGTKSYPRLESINPIIYYSSVSVPEYGSSIREKLEYVLNQSYDSNYGTDVYALDSTYKDVQNISSLIEDAFKSAWSGIVNGQNIRTLDWEGNQWNAGDITCDDGHGNTISMRGLLSRIATLEAAVNS